MKTLCIAMVGGALLASGSAYAEEDGSQVDFFGALAIGMKNLEFDEERRGVITDSLNPPSIGSTFRNTQTFDGDIYYVEVGGGMAIGRFYVSGSYEIPLDEEEVSKKFVGTNNQFRNDVDIDRDDWSVTGGYALTEGISIFAGWKFGETTQESPAPVENGAPPGFKQTYEEEGPFVGVSYGIPISDFAQLAFSVAYADLDAEYKSSAQFGTPSTPTSTNNPMLGPETYSGDATGFSYSVRWSGALTDSLDYFLTAKFQKYELDGKGRRVNLTNPNVTGLAPEIFETIRLDIDTTEEVLAFTAGVQYLF